MTAYSIEFVKMWARSRLICQCSEAWPAVGLGPAPVLSNKETQIMNRLTENNDFRMLAGRPSGVDTLNPHEERPRRF